LTEQEFQESLTHEEKKVLDSIRPNRIIIPVIIGVMAILYLAYRQFDLATFLKIEWTGHIFLWIGISLILLAIRHYVLALRIQKLSGGHFSLWKSIELIFIWEFSSAVSPTSLGGSLVAFFMLAQERLSAARTATIVIYTIIIDTIFFVVSIPLILIIFKGLAVRPGAMTFGDSGAWGVTLVTLTVAMTTYGAFFFYGMFVDPRKLKWLLVRLTGTKWTRRWRERAAQIGDEIILSSKDIKVKGWRFHLEMTFYTFSAWFLRFLILNVLIIGFVSSTSLDLSHQFLMWARSVSMYMIMAFSPTPGASGLAEIVFEGFLADFLPVGLAIVIAFVWRLITYYTYLLGGIAVIPNWIRKVLLRRTKERK
jgi:uncharacterized membrane protein YbhN (UPF0104 family)